MLVLSSHLGARYCLLVGVYALLPGCRVLPADDMVACAPAPGTAGVPLRVTLVLDAVAAAQPTVVRVSTAPAPTPGHSRILVHRRAGTQTVTGPVGELTCHVGGRALGRLAMLDVLADAPSELQVREAGTGALLLRAPLPKASPRLDLRWSSP